MTPGRQGPFLIPPVAFTIAGSDPSGGAGIQADLKTFAAFEVYGAAALTCVTAQDTSSVRAVLPLGADFVALQLDCVLRDLPVAAIKTGLIATLEVVEVVAERLGASDVPLVVDPVAVATSGDELVGPAAFAALRDRLLPLARLVTPNLAEARALSGRELEGAEGLRDAARAIRDLGPRAVLIKGGHAAGPAIDLLLDDEGFLELGAERVAVGPVHGAGCTLSAAITARLAAGRPLREAVLAAKRYVLEGIRAAAPLGRGARPLDHRVRPRL